MPSIFPFIALRSSSCQLRMGDGSHLDFLSPAEHFPRTERHLGAPRSPLLCSSPIGTTAWNFFGRTRTSGAASSLGSACRRENPLLQTRHFCQQNTPWQSSHEVKANREKYFLLLKEPSPREAAQSNGSLSAPRPLGSAPRAIHAET